MTGKEALDFMNIVKAYYPYSYKEFSAQEAKTVVVLWQDAFSDVPLDVMCMALKRHAAKSKFAPTVAEINDILYSIHCEADSFLRYPLFLRLLPEDTIAERKRLRDVTKRFDSARGGFALPPELEIRVIEHKRLKEG